MEPLQVLAAAALVVALVIAAMVAIGEWDA